MPKFEILALVLFIVLSGCIDEHKVNQLTRLPNQSTELENHSTELVNQSTENMQGNSVNQFKKALSGEENIPEIEITSLGLTQSKALHIVFY